MSLTWDFTVHPIGLLSWNQSDPEPGPVSKLNSVLPWTCPVFKSVPFQEKKNVLSLEAQKQKLQNQGQKGT